MADPTTDSPDVEAKARKMGWLPQEDFKGDASKWRPADEYVERGEMFLPIIKAENGKLQKEVDAAKREAAEAKRLFTASQEAIAELQRFHTEDTERQVAKAKRDLQAGIKAAKAAGDDDLEESLREELGDLKAASAAAPAVAPAPKPSQPAIDPAFITWKAENPWFDSDVVKQSLMTGIAQKLRSDPANNTLIGKEFYERCAYDADSIMNPRGNTRTSKMDGGTGRSPGGGPDSGGAPKRLYSDLPKDARDACDRQGQKLVGDGRAFKTNDAWRKHYVEQFFKGE